MSASPLLAQPVGTLDLATVAPGDGVLRRVLGSVGTGAWGVPVAGGLDVDGDGLRDYAMAAQRASPQGRTDAGVIFLVFGDGTITGQLDTAAASHPAILEIHGDQVQENAGSEIWMADITGDGDGDLIICRQNYSPPGRIGAGAVTVIPGQGALRTLAAAGTVLDLRTPPDGIELVTIIGATAPSRLCIWARNGDVTGDGIDDLAVGADRENSHGESDSGAVYVFRGGSHFASSATVDLASFGSVWPGRIARFTPPCPVACNNYHLGATVQVADLDNNGRAEVIAAAALNRAGAALPPAGGTGEGSGGPPRGATYVVWDDNLTGTWIPAPDFEIGAGPGTFTTLRGGAKNDVLGEEILGGRDYDADGSPDLFLGDLTAFGWDAITRSSAGTGHVLYDAASLKNLNFAIDSLPPGVVMATFLGPASGVIAADTAMHGDFNGDGIDDLAFSSPNGDPLGRSNAGIVHIVLGQDGHWPVFSDLAPANFPSTGVDIFEIYGAEGSGGGSAGDVLCYSGAEGDINGDGITDLIINEMQGDGSTVNDVGNLLVIDSVELFGLELDVVFEDGFESD